MKNTILKTETFLILFMLMNSSFVILVEARPLSIIDTKKTATREEVVDFFDWLSLSHSLGGIKDSGPSGPGVGHKFTNIDTLGGIKDSGPSSGGVGHKFTNSETLGGIKDSGPSPGVGH
ncbi:PAMP-induced secreted peptide 2-like [Trifolium pratense]|uniref:PAMP-induced secreted peptide 2-like n=1 Tax=Trifolium pratense TaxID=57577 RepID=UPI001E68FE66|nr:PAMP-induced secreted peptide 2-like [Trifolium pratense]